VWPYSSRNATAGSILVARAAGNQQARVATSVRTEGTSTKVAASRGLVANSMPSTAREPMSAINMPAATPITTSRIKRTDGGQPFRLLDRQRPQQNRVEECEDGGIRPDAQPQGKYGGSSEAAGFP